MRQSLDEYLARLETAGLIRRTTTSPDAEFSFHHVLSQEAAYQSLLKLDRRRLHRLVGTHLEKLSPEQPTSNAPGLAHHFLAAGEDARALPYLELAAGDAARRYANTEAIAFLDRAIGAASRLGLPLARTAELTLRRGRLLELSGRYPEALASYGALDAQARAAKDGATRLAALMAQATVHCAPTSHYDSVLGESELSQALELARQMDDRAAECKALWLQMLRCKWNSDEQLALGYGEQSIAIARELGLTELLAYALTDTVLIRKRLGQSGEADAAARESVALWRALGNLPLLADSLSNIGELGRMSGKLAGADAPIEEALRINEKIQNTWGLSHGRMILGMLRGEQCRYGEAIAHLEAAIHLGEQSGFVMGRIISSAALSTLLSDLGQPAQGLAVAREGVRIATSVNTWRGLPLAAAALCEVQLGASEDASRAVQAASQEVSAYYQLFVLPGHASMQMRLLQGDFQAALDEARAVCGLLQENGNDLNIPRARAIAAEALIGLGRLDEAMAALDDAIRRARDSGIRRGLWRAFALKAACETRRGEKEAARASFAAAEAEISFVLSQLRQEALRQSFENLAEVRAVRTAR